MTELQDDNTIQKRKRGRPKGTPGGGKYNCTTVPVRVPVHLKGKIKSIIGLYESLDSLKSDWEERIATAASESKTGKPSPRYDKAQLLLLELTELLNEDVSHSDLSDYICNNCELQK
jgi:hypothetical protein